MAAAHAGIAQASDLGQCQALCLLFHCESVWTNAYCRRESSPSRFCISFLEPQGHPRATQTTFNFFLALSISQSEGLLNYFYCFSLNSSICEHIAFRVVRYQKCSEKLEAVHDVMLWPKKLKIIVVVRTTIALMNHNQFGHLQST